MPENPYLNDLEQIFRAGLLRADPYQMFIDHLTLEDDVLKVQFENELRVFDLSRFQRIVILGAGKASARMAQAVEDVLGERISAGLIAVKYGYTANLRTVRQIEAGHPVPDENSLRAVREAAVLAAGLDEATLVINLISGGGSALFEGLIEVPGAGGSVALTLADLQQTTQVLLRCGAEIQEINCLRKHLSTVKGGQLVRLLYPATTLNFILSDVIGDRLDAIASGLTVPDSTTFADAQAVIERYDIAGLLPAAVCRAIALGAAGQIPETPKPGDPIFERSHNLLLGSLYNSLLAAGEAARALGYNTLVLTSQLTGEARELAKFLVGLARDTQKRQLAAPRPACLIAGGESTVTLRGSGRGGILYYQKLTGDWSSWWYMWALIPVFVGVGTLLAALLGGKSRGAVREGFRTLLVGLVLFAVFGSFFGAFSILGAYWPLLLVAAGILILLEGLFKR